MRRDPLENRQALYEIASSQGGYFTSAQALTAGYGYSQQSYHVHRGAWQKIEHGIFRLQDYPPSEREDLIRITLWSHNQKGKPQAVVSHETALAIYDLSDVMPQKIHLTVPPTFRRVSPSYCVLHKSWLAPEDIKLREGYTITTPLRTLLDAAESPLSQEHLNRAVQDAIMLGLVRRSKLKIAEYSPKARERLNQALELSTEMVGE
jgi:predicted transcriptional regulator of viral defense system